MSTLSVPERLAFTRAEVLELVPIGKTKLNELISSGQLRTTRIGRRVLITPAALSELIGGGAS